MDELEKTPSGAFKMPVKNTGTPPPPAPPTGGEGDPPPAPPAPPAPPTGGEGDPPPAPKPINRPDGGEGDPPPAPPAPPTGGEGDPAPATRFKARVAPEPVVTPEWFTDEIKTSLGVESYETMVSKINAEPPAAPEPPAPAPIEYVDDFHRAVDTHYREHRDLRPFIEAMGTNWKDMSAEKLIETQIRQENQGLSETSIQRKLQETLSGKYFMNEDASDDDKAYGQDLLKLDAEAIRSKGLENQAEFMPPAPPSVEEMQAAKEAEEKAWRDAVHNNPATQALLSDPNLGIEVDGQEYVYEIEQPQDIVDMAVDTSKFWGLFTLRDERGNPIKDAEGNAQLDYKMFYEVAMFAKERDTYKDSLIGLGRTAENIKLRAELNGGSERRHQGQVQPDSGSAKRRALNGAIARNQEV